MSKLTLKIEKRGQVIKVYEAEKVKLKWGVIDDFFGIFEDIQIGNYAAAIEKRGLLEELLKEIFHDLTYEHLREVDLLDVVSELGPELFTFIGDQLGKTFAKVQKRI